MVVEVELPSTPYGQGYKRPYAPSPLGAPAGSAGTGKAPPLPSPTASAYVAYNPYRPPNPIASSSTSIGASTTAKGASPLPPAPLYTSPYYYPSPTAKIPSPSTSSSPSAPTTVTQAKNYVILDTPDATPASDYSYLFGDHVDWGTLKVLPKNHPCGMSKSRSIRFHSYSPGPKLCARPPPPLPPPDNVMAVFHFVYFTGCQIISFRPLRSTL